MPIHKGSFVIDPRTGVAQLVARLIDTTNYGEGPDFSTPMERRRDFAFVGSDESFIARYASRALLFKKVHVS
jgi:hypothetical protein